MTLPVWSHFNTELPDVKSRAALTHSGLAAEAITRPNYLPRRLLDAGIVPGLDARLLARWMHLIKHHRECARLLQQMPTFKLHESLVS